MTFTTNTVLTAAQLNTHLRDNLLETEAARAQAAGDFFAVEGINRIGRRRVAYARIQGNSSETTTSTEYADLPTVGPSVTVTTGTRAFVWIGAHMTASLANSRVRMSWAISGATERDALDSTALAHDGLTAGSATRRSNYDLIQTTLTPGVNTFTAKYRVGASSVTGTFQNRILIVFPL
ncbi:hypothetical protein ACMA1D_10630 [Streptomyces sp. 796.1]|uniref:hypothetical protein n=1 Tax=Streptomyces sp. 796.1 TaxID=3163029 RepID=UPI0039C93737